MVFRNKGKIVFSIDSQDIPLDVSFVDVFNTIENKTNEYVRRVTIDDFLPTRSFGEDLVVENGVSGLDSINDLAGSDPIQAIGISYIIVCNELPLPIPSQGMASDGSWSSHNIIGDCFAVEVDELILVASRRIGVGSYSWGIEPFLKGVFVCFLEQDVSAGIVLIDNRIIQEGVVLSDEPSKLVVLITGFKLVSLDRGY